MGNDHSVQNSFTPVVRWRLGVLPAASINSDIVAGHPFDLQALTLAPSNNSVSAAMFKCPNCGTRIRKSSGEPMYTWKGGYIWLSFRGTTDKCNDVGCHVDHDAHYNKVFVHYQQPTGGLSYMTTERWYYMGVGETYAPPGADKLIAVCSIDGDAATVIVHDGANSTVSCGGSGTTTTAPDDGIVSACSFETDENVFCNVWSDANSNKANWTRRSEGTPSSSRGPSAAADGSYYLYMEATLLDTGDNAILKSVPITLPGGCVLKFKYSMYESDMGTMNVRAVSGDKQVVWSKIGDQSKDWRDAVVDLGPLGSGTVEITFEAVRDSFWSEFAIDDVVVQKVSSE
jgi:hypothetical protein